MLSRREFLRLVVKGAVLGNFISLIEAPLSQALAAGEVRKLPILWIETGTCTGDSISLDNIWTPTFREILTNIIDWRYDWVMMQEHGEPAIKVLMDTLNQQAGQFILVVQGTIIQRDGGNYNHIFYHDGRLWTGLEGVRLLGSKARHIVAIGTCATYGGVVAGYPNPTKSVGVQHILPERRVINISGCPAHPDWTMGTLLHLALYGEPELDNFGRPRMFYGETVHNRCPRRRYYEQGIFATELGQKECLFRVGCKGPVTNADCPIRRWNDRFNWPIGCNTPCIGCTEPGFPDQMEPFTAHLPDIPFPGGTRMTTDRIGLGVLGLTGAALVGHMAASLYTGRLHHNLLKSSVKVRRRRIVRPQQVHHRYRPKPPAGEKQE